MKKFDDSNQVGRLLIAANAKYPHIKTKAELGLFLGHQGTSIISNWQRRGIPAAKIYEFSLMLECNSEWIKTGEGDMVSKVNELKISIEIEELNLKQRLLDDEDFARVRRFCDDLIRSKGK